MKYLFQTLLLSAVLLIAVSCNDDDSESTSNQTGQVEFTMQGSNGSNTSGRVMNDLEITSATAAVSKVEIEDEGNDSTDDDSNDNGETEIEFEGQYVVDLMAGTSDPAFGIATVDAQNYDKIEIEFGTFLDDNASLIIEGNYTNSSDETIPFKYALNKELEIEIESDSGFEVQEGSVKSIVADIDFSLLFQNIDFELADDNADGLVIIDANLNTYVYNLISQNYNAAIKIEVDDN